MNKKQESILTKITEKKEKTILKEIFGFLLDGGLGSVSKRDLDIFIVHILQKYDARLSNYDWSTLLKISARRIKTLRLEAGIRYSAADDIEEKDLWFKFLDIVREGYITVDKNKLFVLTIEDPYMIRFIDAKLKENRFSSFDYSFNSEILKFNSDSFGALLKTAATFTGIGEGNTKAEEKIKKIKWKNVGDDAKDFLKEVLKGLFPTLVA